jgi:glucose 1-dehydrogenase
MGKKVEQENLPSVVMPSCEMRKILAGQKALATGANSGIGKTVAIALGQAGADVVVNYVTNPGQAEEVVAKIRESGVKAYAHQADVSQEDQVKAMFARMCEEFGTIDIMVNNAGLQRDAKLEEMTLRQWDTVIGVNLTGQFLCAREAVREFKRRGVRPEISCAAGKIICISSVHEVIPWAGHVNYAASKGDVMGRRTRRTWRLGTGDVGAAMIEVSSGGDSSGSGQTRTLQRCALHDRSSPESGGQSTVLLCRRSARLP